MNIITKINTINNRKEIFNKKLATRIILFMTNILIISVMFSSLIANEKLKAQNIQNLNSSQDTILSQLNNSSPAPDLSTNLGNSFKIPNPTKFNDLEDIINAGTSLIRVVVILTLSIMILYGGFTRLTSAGDEEKIKQSSKILTAAIAGFVIIVFAAPIVDFLGQLLGVKGGLVGLNGSGQ